MIRIILAVFLILHGGVHLLYLGQSARIFELQPGMTWPDGAWALQKIIADDSARMLASVLLLIAALILAAGSAGLVFKQDWWRSLTAAAGIFSTVTFVLLWDGRLSNLANQGWVGILINLLILAALWIIQRPLF